MMKKMLAVMAAAALVAGACGDDAGGSSPTTTLAGPCAGYPAQGFVVEGDLDNAAGLTLPAAMGLHVAWVVSTGEDYAYAFGEGCVDPEAGRYLLALPTDPPVAALNTVDTCSFGVGTMVLVQGEVSDGDDIGVLLDEDPSRIVGAAPRHGVLFVAGDCAALAEEVPWLGDFDPGYGLGVCEANPGGFDAFRPVDTSTKVSMTVTNDAESLEWCNWT